MKQGAKIHQSSGKHTLRYHAFQTAGQWVRGELRNMQVAGLINNDENRPKLSSQNETEVVDQGRRVVLLCCSAVVGDNDNDALGKDHRTDAGNS